MEIRRWDRNPILAPRPDLSWCSRKLYNSAAVRSEDSCHLIFRGIGDDVVSRLGHASSTDGVAFSVDPAPVFFPTTAWEAAGCEDPRITKLEDRYWMLYTAFDGRTARCAMTSTTDFRSWGPRRLLFPEWREGRWNEPSGRPVILAGFDPSTWRSADATWSKAAALFPEKVGGEYWLYFGDDQLWAAHSADLVDWEIVPEPVLPTRVGLFDAAYVEMGPPPIRVPEGWLILYHGVDRLDRDRVYRLGVAIVSPEDPLRVLSRPERPILEPIEAYETTGTIDVVHGLDAARQASSGAVRRRAHQDGGHRPRAVFCCGATTASEGVHIYYSGADTVLCLAELSL